MSETVWTCHKNARFWRIFATKEGAMKYIREREGFEPDDWDYGFSGVYFISDKRKENTYRLEEIEVMAYG